MAFQRDLAQRQIAASWRKDQLAKRGEAPEVKSRPDSKSRQERPRVP